MCLRPGAERDHRLDFFRAISLWLLYLEELSPPTAGWMNVRFYGFSDAAIIFIFVFGYTAGAVYGEMPKHGYVFGGSGGGDTRGLRHASGLARRSAVRTVSLPSCVPAGCAPSAAPSAAI